MDIHLARTFLAIIDAGNFAEAAKRVHVTQSTVSMRVKALEQQLGKPLFRRSKAGATLTPAGAQFEKHALAILRSWEQARLEVSLPAGHRSALTIGGSYSLWAGFLLGWISQMRAEAPDIALRARIGFSGALMQDLIDGTLDVGVMYTPNNRPGLHLDMLFEDELVLVSSEAPPRRDLLGNYVYIDWGPEFQADHSLNFAHLPPPGLYLELGMLGLKYVLDNHASGYFPKRIIMPYVADGTLALVPDTPVFTYPVYAVHPTGGNCGSLDLVLENLRAVASLQMARSSGPHLVQGSAA